ncbi:hypothetical protein CDAR_527421 [Caerostris darwini]|uniref:Uncharacterized protein n=1 Tax=Caerostris darwini TaxID=1538125 RepID=A0AAV4WL22_9ARAC|nr:hypothetical protein CDAR_527421 [Caerostris darwini]
MKALSSASEFINFISGSLALKKAQPTNSVLCHSFIYLSINLSAAAELAQALGNKCNGGPIVGRLVITHPFLLPIRDDLKLPPKTFPTLKMKTNALRP